jgi:hypothetical protein
MYYGRKSRIWKLVNLMPMEREAHVLRQKIQNLEARELDDARSLGRIEGTLGIKVDDE